MTAPATPPTLQDRLNHEDFSFLALRLAFMREGTCLVGREVALRLADGVLEYYYGPERHRRNLPLSISEAENGDDWVVRGAAAPITPDSSRAEPDLAGRFEIHINKFNARITKMVFV